MCSIISDATDALKPATILRAQSSLFILEEECRGKSSTTVIMIVHSSPPWGLMFKHFIYYWRVGFGNHGRLNLSFKLTPILMANHGSWPVHLMQQVPLALYSTTSHLLSQKRHYNRFLPWYQPQFHVTSVLVSASFSAPSAQFQMLQFGGQRVKSFKS